MSAIIQIRRSTGANLPSSLAFGELAHISGIGSFDGDNQYKDRIYIGHNDASTPDIVAVGGRYYTSMMDHQPGAIDGVTNPINSDGSFAVTLDGNRKVDLWNVDNLRLDTNTLSATNTDGGITLLSNGTGKINLTSDEVNISGAATIGGQLTTNDIVIQGNTTLGGDLTVANVGISTNLIQTTSGDVLYIDPHPAGLSNQGKVVIKGDLQVDGNSNVVNSTELDIVDPIVNLGKTTIIRTVMEKVLVGVSTIKFDSVSGLNNGDLVTGSDAISAGTTITNISTTTKIITLSNSTSINHIQPETQLTVTVDLDTNTDRGVSFNYNIGEGSSDARTGFFGYIDQTNSGSSAVQRSWTYIPEASITNNVVTGTRGYLDIKGIYYQTGDYNLNGLVYFDVNGLQTSTVSPDSGISTSNYVMTTNSSNVPTWTDVLDGGSY
tara:strand:+ start:2974 stop:4281 length:1308 start_codon:yes stop_codon:yes gene_type:complete